MFTWYAAGCARMLLAVAAASPATMSPPRADLARTPASVIRTYARPVILAVNPGDRAPKRSSMACLPDREGPVNRGGSGGTRRPMGYPYDGSDGRLVSRWSGQARGGGPRPPQRTAFFTSAASLASSAAVSSFSAKATGHTVPSSRFALSLKPNVAYLALNLWALWK